MPHVYSIFICNCHFWLTRFTTYKTFIGETSKCSEIMVASSEWHVFTRCSWKIIKVVSMSIVSVHFWKFQIHYLTGTMCWTTTLGKLTIRCSGWQINFISTGAAHTIKALHTTEKALKENLKGILDTILHNYISLLYQTDKHLQCVLEPTIRIGRGQGFLEASLSSEACASKRTLSEIY